ncbi:MAG: hypothetical protein U5S82_12905 [Gammaproteobacteria bacterium]|nr:hypothetical protein [Gammaproteobacteria bacterium]
MNPKAALFVIGLIAFIMTTQLSSGIWAVVEVLHVLQTPFRFNTVLIFPVIALAAMAAQRVLSAPMGRTYAGEVVLVVVLLALVSAPLKNAVWNVQSALADYSEAESVSLERLPLDGKEIVRKEQDEYIVAGLDESLLRLPYLQENALKETRAFLADGTTVELHSRAGVLEFDAKLPEAQCLEISQFWYPMWRGALVQDGIREKSLTMSRSSSGLLRTCLPGGQVRAKFWVSMGLPGRVATAVSAIAMTTTLIMLGSGLRNRRRARERLASGVI